VLELFFEFFDMGKNLASPLFCHGRPPLTKTSPRQPFTASFQISACETDEISIKFVPSHNFRAFSEIYKGFAFTGREEL
jgi:hypothetical protein